MRILGIGSPSLMGSALENFVDVPGVSAVVLIGPTREAAAFSRLITFDLEIGDQTPCGVLLHDSACNQPVRMRSTLDTSEVDRPENLDLMADERVHAAAKALVEAVRAVRSDLEKGKLQ